MDVDEKAKLMAEVAVQIFTRGFQGRSNMGAVTVPVSPQDAVELARQIVLMAGSAAKYGRIP